SQQAARVRVTRRPYGLVSSVLLENGFALHPDRDPLSQRDVERTPMDCKSLQQRLPGGTRSSAVRAAAIAEQAVIGPNMGKGLGCPSRRHGRRARLAERDPTGSTP